MKTVVQESNNYVDVTIRLVDSINCSVVKMTYCSVCVNFVIFIRKELSYLTVSHIMSPILLYHKNICFLLRALISDSPERISMFINMLSWMWHKRIVLAVVRDECPVCEQIGHDGFPHNIHQLR